MDSTPVNWEALDTVVIEFAKLENLIEDSSSAPSPSSSSYHSRLIIRQIRRFLETGAIDAAVDLLRLHAPSILNDHRILFRLHKQVRIYLYWFCGFDIVIFWFFCCFVEICWASSEGDEWGSRLGYWLFEDSSCSLCTRCLSGIWI